MREINRLAEMETFLAVAAEGSYTSAALSRQMSPSAVSKMMARLEQRLGVTLIRRTTRRLQITEEGRAFAEAARGILDALDQAEREAGAGPAAGLVRIATSASYANHILAPRLPALLARHPGLEIELMVCDGIADIGGQPIDLAIRAGPLPDSSLRARSLGKAEIISVRAPGAGSGRVGIAYPRRDPFWKEAPARLRASDGNTVAALARHGCGLARVSRFVIAEELAAGRLEEVPGGPTGREEFHIVYLGTARTLPMRISIVLDFVTAEGRVDR
ncbi:LysR family transcriptional regulator [Poseidonocella sp. HB161398]|uniref:LysR family transcriptional regulator n=1 Tax=Poseidonocella sp. HB161398 TaxID=2320855 RepID=UPI001109A307|nr:LysR family transcriptional regulator [Poseidonocella sp. HB161398]